MKLNSENMNINLRHLRALNAIYEEGSFSAAAMKIGVVPSALSEIVRQLEMNIGAPLFDRSTRPPTITKLAKDFLFDTAPLLEGMDGAVSRLRQGAGLEIGSLSIGASPSAISEFVAPSLGRFLDQHPGIKCLIHDDVAEYLAAMVSDGRLDLAIAGRALRTKDLLQHPIASDSIGLVCGKNHPLNDYETITIDDVCSHTVIGLNQETGTYRLLDESPQIPRSLLSSKILAHSTVSQLCMVRSGLGVALLPQKAAEVFNDPSIVFRNIQDLKISRWLYVLVPSRRPVSLAAKAFIEFLTKDFPSAFDDFPLSGK